MSIQELNSYSDLTNGDKAIIKYGYSEFSDYYHGCEPTSKKWWNDNIKKEWNIIDAGANVGVYTILFGKKCNKVYAIEPCKETFDALKNNLDENKITNVELFNMALSNSVSTKKDKIYHRWGSSPLDEEFEFTTIDKLVEDNKIKVNAIKIDVDSYDFEVLQGCKNTLIKQNPVVVVEISILALSLRGFTKDDIFKFMENLNYKNTGVYDGENHVFEYCLPVDKDYLNLAFNSDGYVMKEVEKLIKHTNVKYAVETGTYKGSTTVFLSKLVPNVHSIEIDNNNYNESKSNFEKLKIDNIVLHKGSSEEVFKTLLPKLKEEAKDEYIFFYLDAHWNDYWPLLDELELISKFFNNKAIIVIDDFQIPNRDYGFDSYKGQPNNFEYVKNKIEQVYTDGYTYWYNGKCEPILSYKHTAGKLYVVPKSIRIDWLVNYSVL
jgi:FkbM family methyltransferase